jgi:hypothetical protein
MHTAARLAVSPAPATPAPRHVDLFHRIRAEYVQMPGLHLTAAQARRLFGLDAASAGILDALVDARFLKLTRTGAYARAESY